MSGIIHFSSGKTLEITEQEFRNISPTLNGRGIKTQKLKSGNVVPMNSMTMEFIEHIPEVEEERVTVGEVILPPGQNMEQKELKEKPKKRTQAELLEEMMAKSNCLHEPEKMELYIQHTAKGIRYFPVCSFCGKREKYVSERKIVEGAYKGTPNEKWTEEDLPKAKPWID